MATALLAACGAPGLDRQQTTEERRTCASLRERVAARALDEAGLPESDREPEKGDGLSPLTLLAEPAAWYRTLDAALTDAAFGPRDEPSSTSPASLLVERCRRLEP